MTNFMPDFSSLKVKLIAGGALLLLLVASFLAGHYTSHPAKEVLKVEDTTKIDSLKNQMVNLQLQLQLQIQTNERLGQQIEMASKVNKTKKTTIHKLPTGEITIEKTEESQATASSSEKKQVDLSVHEDSVANQTSQASSQEHTVGSRTVDTEKTTTWERPGWRVKGQVGVDLGKLGPLLYQVGGARRLFGTLWVDGDVQLGDGSWRAFIGPALEF